jgi:hypothetical protein
MAELRGTLESVKCRPTDVQQLMHEHQPEHMPGVSSPTDFRVFQVEIRMECNRRLVNITAPLTVFNETVYSLRNCYAQLS